MDVLAVLMLTDIRPKQHSIRCDSDALSVLNQRMPLPQGERHVMPASRSVTDSDFISITFHAFYSTPAPTKGNKYLGRDASFHHEDTTCEAALQLLALDTVLPDGGADQTLIS
jgi:hypothetical protein